MTNKLMALQRLNEKSLTAIELDLDSNEMWEMLKDNLILFSRCGGGKLLLTTRGKDLLMGVKEV